MQVEFEQQPYMEDPDGEEFQGTWSGLLRFSIEDKNNDETLATGFLDFINPRICITTCLDDPFDWESIREFEDADSKWLHRKIEKNGIESSWFNSELVSEVVLRHYRTIEDRRQD